MTAAGLFSDATSCARHPLADSRPTNDRIRTIVLGYIVRGPLGGLAWHHLQYVIALIRLGHDVYFVEDSDDYPSCYNPDSDEVGTDPAYGLRFIADAFEQLHAGDRWAYFDAHSNRWLGPAGTSIGSRLKTADMLLNLSAMNPLRPWLAQIPIRVFLDTDPAFTQVRILSDPNYRSHAEQHTVFLTYAEKVADGSARLPDDGFPWLATRQPVTVDAWTVTPSPVDGRFTTVMQWDSYAAREHAGIRYGMKSASFAPFLDLPSRTSQELELAIGSATAPRRELQRMGWFLRDPRGPSGTPWTYQDYLRSSRGEFSVAKHGYVVSRSGWFSERSANYLASGRPVVTQETRFSNHIPCGEGLFAVTTVDEAAAAIEAINTDYERHSRAAREIAVEYFEASKVMGRMLDEIGSAAR